MKCNYKVRQHKDISDRITQVMESVKRLWEIATLLALHREFGFGPERLKRFSQAMGEVYKEIDARASVTDRFDKHGQKMSNIDEAIIKVVRELRAAGIDHRVILEEDEKLMVYKEDGTAIDLDEFLDRMEEREQRWRGR